MQEPQLCLPTESPSSSDPLTATSVYRCGGQPFTLKNRIISHAKTTYQILFLKIFILLFLVMCKYLCLCVGICVVMQVAEGPKGICYLGDRVTDGFEPPIMDLGN